MRAVLSTARADIYRSVGERPRPRRLSCRSILSTSTVAIARRSRSHIRVGAAAPDQSEQGDGLVTGDGSAVQAQAPTSVLTLIENLSDADIAATPELIPLRDAVIRARETTEELAAKREALEAEAQSVAELAVMEESKLRELEARFVGVEKEMDALLVEEAALKQMVAAVQERLKSQAESPDELEEIEQIDSISSDLDALATLSEELGLDPFTSFASVDGEESGSVATMEDLLWLKTEQLMKGMARQEQI